MDRRIIAFYSPCPGMGKSTAQSAAYDAVRAAGKTAGVVSFGTQVRECASFAFPLNRGMFYSVEKKDEKIPGKQFTPRDLMIAFGNAGRSLDPDFWVDFVRRIVHSRCTPDDITLFLDDLRFPNEYEALKSWGAKVVRIWRPGKDVCTTETEGLLEHHDFDAQISNDGTLDEFKERVVQTVRGLMPEAL